MASSHRLSFTINGTPYHVDNVDPRLTLLDFLRQNGLTGAKEGCAEGDCGACTVVSVESNNAGTPTYRSINSCLMLLPMAAGRQFLTAEGMAEPALHPVQKALVEHHGSQCGYCTPGFVGSMFEAYYRPGQLAPWQIADQLCGNLCRCTGYRPIRDAAEHALAQRHVRTKNTEIDAHATALQRGASEAPMVCYARQGQRFTQPDDLGSLLAHIAREPDAKLVGGATEIAVEVNKKGARFPHLISTMAVAELRQITEHTDSWVIGGAATLTDVEEALAGAWPAIDKMLRVFASRQIRNRATLAGNLATASPIGDMAPVLLALDAEVILRSEQGSRTLPLADFFIGYRQTALLPGELLYGVRLAKPTLPEGWRRLCDSYKVSKRRELDISAVAACFCFELDTREVIRKARLAYGGVASTPVRATAVEALLVGQSYGAGLLERVQDTLARQFEPVSDLRGSAGYRRGLIQDLFAKFIHGASSAGQDTPLDYVSGRPTVTPDSSRALPHDSAHGHVSGRARFVHDQVASRRVLEAWPVISPHARARIVSIDTSAAAAHEGVVAILTAADIPGRIYTGPVQHDEALLATDVAEYHGHPVALVIATSRLDARAAARVVAVSYEPLPALSSIEESIAEGAFLGSPRRIERGQPIEEALNGAPHRLGGELAVGGQEHFYLETQAAWAERGDQDDMLVVSSTQHPTEVQETVAEVLGLHAHQVVAQSPRLGGAFGGKESQARTWAALAALGAWCTRQPCRLQLDRDVDMLSTGKRHPFLARYDVGYDDHGRLQALDVALLSNGGYSLDLSSAILDRALFHIDNAYYVPNLAVSGRVVKTHTASNTAFRGFGGPQAMVVIEEVIDRVARSLGLDPAHVRERNLYHGEGASNTTHYGQPVGDNRLPRMWKTLCEGAQLSRRRLAVDAHNASSPHIKRGLAITPVKFGISFTTAFLNQAGALLNLYRDGTAQVSIAGTEMGQGLNTKVLGVVVRELGIAPDCVRVMVTSTEKVPNTSPTAASSGADLNGAAVKRACEDLRQRLLPLAAELLEGRIGQPIALSSVRFANGRVHSTSAPATEIPLANVAARAHQACVSLSATGYYSTEGLCYDPDRGRGTPFHYFACGVAVSEVEVDGFTGMKRLLRTDILHDVGDSLNPAIDRGQIEGAFLQGVGWLTSEELIWDTRGHLQSHGASTYQIPAFSDAPAELNVSLLHNATQPNTIHGSKAVGEPPFMLAISVREAIRDAVAAFQPDSARVELPAPATHEAIYGAIKAIQRP